MTPNQAKAELIAHHGWSRETLEVWCRAGFRCEYCPENLLKSSDAYFRGGHIDHIVPGGGDHLDNLALACAPCNYLKRGTDPRVGGSGIPTRDALISAAKRIIEDRRRAANARLEQAMPFLRVLGAPEQN